MADATFIPRHKAAADEYSFESLRELGLARVQDLARNIWTDYNDHDPGITILEQVCYALTDIVFRADFPVADFLVQENGAIDWERQGLHPAEVAFPARPATELDYRTILLDAVPEIENLRLETITHPDGRPTGLYKILLRTRAEADSGGGNTSGVSSATNPTANPTTDLAGQPPASRPTSQGGDAQARMQIVDKVRRAFSSARNLCETIDSIVMESAVDVFLNAEIEIQEGFDPAQILARIYDKCGNWLAAGIQFTSYEHALNQGKSPEAVFQGPLVSSGMIVKSTSQSRTSFSASDAYALLKSVPGVENVKTFPSSRNTPHAPGTPLRLHWPKDDSEIGVKIVCNQREIKVSVHDLTMRYEELHFAHSSMRSDRSDSIVPRPQGKIRDIEDYLSIQYHFPAIYGVGPRGVPESASDHEKAAVKQLKGYLLFFDQQMADMLAMLANLRTLYSTGIDKRATYFSQLLDEDNFPGIADLYDREGVAALQRMPSNSSHADRATRLVDYLLALYGEGFRDDPLMPSGTNQTPQQRDATMDAILDERIAYLKDIANITRDRAAATDYLKPPGDRHNRSGLEAKLSHLLGFEKHDQATGLGVRVMEHILLRPIDWTPNQTSTEAFRVSVLFPDWLYRSKDENFRKYAADTVDACCPAHIYADIHWLGRERMSRFDNLHREWWQSRGEPTRAGHLLAFLTELEDANRKANRKTDPKDAGKKHSGKEAKQSNTGPDETTAPIAKPLDRGQSA